MAQREEPWSHLHSSPTVASARRSTADAHGVNSTEKGSEALSTSLKVSETNPDLISDLKNLGDSLDFQLQSVYDHSKDFFWTKNQMLYQKETVSELPRCMFVRL